MDANPHPISIDRLADAVAAPGAPLILDVRPAAAVRAEPVLIPGARWRNPAATERWLYELPRRPLVVYGARGRDPTLEFAGRLSAAGWDAAYVEGGLAAWRAAGRATVRSLESCGLGTAPSRWVTRARPKIDRIACPWLILRFVDPEARFLYVPASEVTSIAAATGAVPFDVPEVRFGHVGERCSFDAFVETFAIDNPPLATLARIVRGADTSRLELAPEAPGLLAVSRGLSALFADDHEMLRHGLVVYDALYAWYRTQVGKPA